MNRIKEMISSKKLSGISDYFKLYNELNQETIKDQLKNNKIKIALLSSFTIKGLKETLFVKCCEIGIAPEFYVADYNQYAQDVLNPESELYKYKPDLIIIFIDAMTILNMLYLSPYQISEEERKQWVYNKVREMLSLIDKIKENLSSKILLHNFEIPLHSPLGIFENKQRFGFVESIELLNAKLRDAFKNDTQTFVFDYNSFCSKIGKQSMVDYKLYYLGDIKVNLQHIPKLCDEYLSYIKPLVSLIKKCIVLDLDNTLWGGIIGEDGLEGIKLGPASDGMPFFQVQKYLLSLFNRGIILAINSNNNLDDALKVFRQHPYMILKEEHFASMQINWNDKISNMKAIAEEISVGMDSIVFIDDDKLNREMIKKAFPEVLVVDLPDDVSLYLKTLMELNEFNSYQITEEDVKRGRMYAEQRLRKEFQHSSTDLTEYLKGLEIVVKIEKANSFTIPRIAQLTQKTNQFNMTTKRYQDEDIKQFSKNGNYIVVSVRVEDKFGDNGITGAAIIEKAADGWRIDTFLLSCRIIGRKIEETLLGHILSEAKKEKAKALIGEFIPTNKNAPARDFYKNNGFEFVANANGVEKWVYNIERDYNMPNFIKVMISN